MTVEGQVAVTGEVQCYAVVGKVNAGKSAVLATLLEEDDDRIIRISPEPGETTRCQRLSLVMAGSERLRFIDTPSFQQPIAALRHIRALHGDAATQPDRATLQRFVAECRQQFPDECRLLEPLLEGAGVVYVLNPAVPLYDSFRAEIEILRWTGRPRLAVLNSKGGAGRAAHEDTWRAHLGTAFNLVRAFNAHRARFAARRQLLVALNQIEETQQGTLEATLQLLDEEWRQRREQSAEAMLACIGRAFAWRETGRYRDDETSMEKSRERLVEQLRLGYFKHISALERDCSQQLLAIHRHHIMQAQLWRLAADDFGPDLDLAHADTWRRLGLNRKQLTAAGATIGAGAGLGVDSIVLGHALGLPTLAGGIGGGALAFFKGDALPTLKVGIGDRDIAGGRQLSLGPPRNPNFGWVLLDSLLLRYRQILDHPHGRREGATLPAPGAHGPAGLVTDLPADRRKTLTRWFRACLRGRGEGDDGVELTALHATLDEVEQELTSTHTAT